MPRKITNFVVEVCENGELSTSGRILVLGDLYLEKDYGRHAEVSLTRGVHAGRMCDAQS